MSDTAPDDPSEQKAANALVAHGKRRLAEGRGRFEQWFSEHRDHTLVDVGLRLYTRDKEAAASVVGSAIAFRLFLFFVPLVLLVVGALGFVSSQIDNSELSDAGISSDCCCLPG